MANLSRRNLEGEGAHSGRDGLSGRAVKKRRVASIRSVKGSSQPSAGASDSAAFPLNAPSLSSQPLESVTT